LDLGRLLSGRAFPHERADLLELRRARLAAPLEESGFGCGESDAAKFHAAKRRFVVGGVARADRIRALPQLLKAVLSNTAGSREASSATVPPSPCGYCSVARTPTPRCLAPSSRRRMFHTIRSWPGISEISFCCTSITARTVSSADISSGLRVKWGWSVMQGSITEGGTDGNDEGRSRNDERSPNVQ
jgi:hypothetical protein